MAKKSKNTAPKSAPRRVEPAASRTPGAPAQRGTLSPEVAQQITQLVDQRIKQVLLTVAQAAAQQRAGAAAGPRPGGAPMGPQAGPPQGAPMQGGARPQVDPRMLAALAQRLRGGGR